MITEEELQTMFSVEIQSDITPVTYRKYTTDTIPTYNMRLSNLSDTVHIATYARLPEYMTITNPITGALITETQGILLTPRDIVDVIVVFNPTGIDASTDTSPQIIFDLQALEQQDITLSTPATPTSGRSGRPISRGVGEVE